MRDHSPKPPSTASLREELKRATQDLHRRVDARMDPSAIASDLDSYRVFLESMRMMLGRFCGAHDAGCREIGIEPRSPALLAALDADLECLASAQRPPLAADEQGLPPNSVTEALGVTYALEGSAMGAKVMLGRVQEGLGAAAPTQYLEATATGLERRWPSLLGALDAPGIDREPAVRGAQSVFEYLLRPGAPSQ